MILTSSIAYMESELNEFAVSYKVNRYIKDLVMEQLFTIYGLTEKDKNVHLGLSIIVYTKTEKLSIEKAKIDKKRNVDHEVLFPYHQIKAAPDERTEYINVFFEALKIVLPQYGIPVDPIEEIKAMVFEELKNNPDEYIYKPNPKPNMDEVLKKLGYDANTNTFHLSDGDKQIDP